MTQENQPDSGQPIIDDEQIDEVLEKCLVVYNSAEKDGKYATRKYSAPRENFFLSRDVKSNSFDAKNLQRVVDEIKVIEDGLKSIIASRTQKTIEEKIPVKKTRPAKLNPVLKAAVALGLRKPKMETYTDYEIRKKVVPVEPDEVVLTEFKTMIEKYIHSLKGLNEGLRETVMEVDGIVKNLTEVSDAFTDQIHADRKAYNEQVRISKEIEAQLEKIIPIHENMSPIHDKYAEIEKARDHLEMALRDSQGVELKLKTNIDMGVKYQAALKSYRTLINDFKERGDIHVNMVDKFAEGAEHMKIAVDNVSQICSGVARVTQSMIMIVESIDDGNRVLGRYASLIGDQITSSPRWEMEYNALKEAEMVYKKNNELRMEAIEDNREEINRLINRE